MREENPNSLNGVKVLEKLYSIRMSVHFTGLAEPILPPENLPEFMYEEFHSLMVEEGKEGIEYVQESLHSGFFREEFYSSPEDIRKDFELFKSN